MDNETELEMALRYRGRGERARESAEAESNPRVRKTLLQIAASYETLAVLHENRGSRLVAA